MATTALLVVGCQMMKDAGRGVKGAATSLGTNAGNAVASLFEPFIPDESTPDPTDVKPNPAIEDSAKTIGGLFGPWGALGGILVGVGLTVGAQIINSRKKKSSSPK